MQQLSVTLKIPVPSDSILIKNVSRIEKGAARRCLLIHKRSEQRINKK